MMLKYQAKQVFPLLRGLLEKRLGGECQRQYMFEFSKAVKDIHDREF